MKKLLLGALLLLSTTNTFSQNVTNFYLYISKPYTEETPYCPYSVTGEWIDTLGQPQQGDLYFTVQDTSYLNFYDVWYGQVPSNSATCTMSICVVPSLPCPCPSVCTPQLPITQGQYAILLCDSTARIEEQTQNSSLLNNKYYDLLGREIKDITTYPFNSLYIKNGRKYIKTK
jgi:hypothetical protein